MPRPILILATADELTREIFGNIPPAAKACFYAAAVAASGIFCFGVYRRARRWRLGRPSDAKVDILGAARRLVTRVLFPRRLLDRRLAGTAHALLFSGFVVLLIGTTLIAVEHVLAWMLGREATEPVFHKGVYFGVFEILMDTFGLALLLGCALFAVHRTRRPPSVDHTLLDSVVLGAIFLIGVTGYVVEGLRIVVEQTPLPQFSFVGYLIARGLSAMHVDATVAAELHFAAWWLHAVLALGLIAAFSYTRLLHSLAGALNLTLSDPPPLGSMRLVAIEEVEQAGTFGAGRIEQFDRRQLLELDACVSCGRCEQQCPAYEAGKPLSPMALVQDVRRHLDLVARSDRAATTIGAGEEAPQRPEVPALHGETISAATLWSCTTCAACIDVCPLGVRPLDLITDMRRFLIGEGQLRGAPATALQKVQRSGNPWGLPADERFDWAVGLDVPTAAEHPDFEVLYWVGCAASYDRRAQNVARCVARLLQLAGVDFAVLGREERCTGECPRRMGDEFLFDELAGANVHTLEKYHVKKIVTHCPHCLNSFDQDYPQLGGRYDVVHHSQFLMDLVRHGRLAVDPAKLQGAGPTITYHDPCYLARASGITEEPRQILEAIVSEGRGSKLVEMPRNRHCTSCCGAGGGRMWFDDAPAERIGASRVDEALSTGATTISVACPFCLLMTNDGVAAKDQAADVRDVAELLFDVVAAT
jgi:Fe-S oxidoreductase/nitrate reductase gamma subunit